MIDPEQQPPTEATLTAWAVLALALAVLGIMIGGCS